MITIASGQVINNIDFGNQDTTQPGSIHGTKWNDLDHDGVHDAGEPGFAGLTVYADLNGNSTLDYGIDVDPGPGVLLEPYTVTMADNPLTPTVDETGTYSMNLPPGSYVIREVVPAGFVQSYPALGAHSVTVAPGQSIAGLDYGNYEPVFLPDGDDTIHAEKGDDIVVYGDNRITMPGFFSTGTLRDTIQGGEGKDNLFGQEGDDILWGGDDKGTIIPIDDNEDDIIDGGSGIDEVRQTANADQTLNNVKLTGQGDDTLIDIERAELTGGTSDNTLDASAFSGSATLDGKAGSDTLKGGVGNSVFVFGEDANGTEVDKIAELPGGGIDTLDFSSSSGPVTVDLSMQSVASQYSGTNVVRTIVMLTGSQSSDLENIVGTNSDDTITGNDVDNVILALGGSDHILSAGDGNDMINLGLGSSETAEGGMGDDVYVFDGEWGSDTLTDAGGIDTVDFSSITRSLTFAIGGLGVTDGTNTVTHGNSNFERLIGGLANDVFKFLSSSTLPVNGSIDGRGGIDLLDYSLSSSTVTVDLTNHYSQLTSAPVIVVQNIENVTGTVFGDNIIGDDVRNVLRGGTGNDFLDGRGSNDELHGDADADQLRGGVGDDLLAGGIGIDILDGEDGSDLYAVAEGDAGDVINDLGNLGTDVLDLAGGYSQITGITAVTKDLDFVVGGPLALGHTVATFQIDGTELVRFTDTIEEVRSGTGDDVFKFHSNSLLAGAHVDGGEGINSLDYTSYTNGSSGAVVDLFLGTASGLGTGKVVNIRDVTGSVLVDSITGDDKNNTLLGLDGNDVLSGGRGDDILNSGPGSMEALFGGPDSDTYILHSSLTKGTLYEDDGEVVMGVAYSGGSDTIDLSTFMVDIVVDLNDVDFTLGTTQLHLRFPGGGTSITLSDGTIITPNQFFENVIGSQDFINTLTGNANDNLLVGGNAIDILAGGAGNDVLVGGTGDDNIVGNAGRDILIGGFGFDTIDANDSEQDIIVGGNTDYDGAATEVDDRRAWQHIQAVWSATNLDLNLRKTRIAEGVGKRVPNGPFALNSLTIHDDLVADSVTSDVDDWFPIPASGSGSGAAMSLAVEASGDIISDADALGEQSQFRFDRPAAFAATFASRLSRDAAFSQIESTRRQPHVDLSLVILLTETTEESATKNSRIASSREEENERERNTREKPLDRFFADLSLGLWARRGAGRTTSI